MKRKVIYALLSVLIAIGLWMYVVTVVNPEFEDTFYNIPLVLDNEDILLDRGLMLVTDEIPKVTLRLSGNRTDMIKLNSSNITLKADLSKIYSAGEQSLSYDIFYPGDVPNNAFEIISQTPKQITLSVSEWKSKDVDVRVSFNGAVPEQFIAFKDKANLDVEKITVTGPSAVIDRIAMAKITVDLEGKTDTINQKYSYILCDADENPVETDYVKTNVDEVLYTLRIQRWKDIELRLDVVDGGGLKQSDCTITITPPTIRVSGSEKMLEALDYLVLGRVELGKLEADLQTSYDIVLPEGITNLSEQSVAKVTIDIPDHLVVQEVLLKNFQYQAPANMNVRIITLEMNVKVRGPQELVTTVTEQDLYVQVDFANAEVGTNTYKAMILVGPRLANQVGVIGSYEITAEVTAAG